MSPEDCSAHLHPDFALCHVLSDNGSRRNRSVLHVGGVGVRNSGLGDWDLAVDGGLGTGLGQGLGALAADVAGLTAPVAGLAGRVERTAVGSRAVAGDVTKLATSVALHGLSLAVASEMVRSAAFVAGSCAVAALETTATEAALEAAARGGTDATTHGRTADSWGWAVALGLLASAPNTKHMSICLTAK